MDITSLGSGQHEVHLTETELRIICNCMNETCNGIAVPEFETRVGAVREDVEAMLNKLLAALAK